MNIILIMYRNLGEEQEILIELEDMSGKKNQPAREPSPPSNYNPLNYPNP